MTLREISYELLMILRGGYISDDERIDFRLLNSLVNTYRKDYIEDNSKGSQNVPEALRQHTSFDLSNVDHTQYTRLETLDKIPRISVNKFGPMIEEIYSSYVDEFPYTVVNRTALRYSGNGKFNKDIIYVAYDNDKLYFKVPDDRYKDMDKISVSAVFSEPEDVPGFDVEEDEYPLDLDGVSYVKDKFMSNDVKLLLAQYSDEINDASGEIKE